MAHDGALLTPGGGKWKLNLRSGEPVRMRQRGRDVTARPEFVGIPSSAGGGLDRDRLRVALAHGFRVVRWHLDPDTAA